MAAARKKKDAPEEVSLPTSLPGRKPRKRFYMQKMPDGVGERAVRAGSLRSGARE